MYCIIQNKTKTKKKKKKKKNRPNVLYHSMQNDERNNFVHYHFFDLRPNNREKSTENRNESIKSQKKRKVM